MPEYREIAPPPHLGAFVECFWTMRGSSGHRVMPDGCADILLQCSRGSMALNVVGAMTGYRDTENAAGDSFLGIRFRPGGWAHQIGVPADRITNLIEPLDSFWGSRGAELRERLGSAATDEQRMAILAAALTAQPEMTPVRRAIRWMEQCHGCVSLDRAADRCGLSGRQFRRVFLAETGVTPKFLARVLRFRHALARVSSLPGADLALDCGYYDQAHLINEFREFSGRTPYSFAGMTDFSNRRPDDVA